MPDSGSEDLLGRLRRIGEVRFLTKDKTVLPGERVAFIRYQRKGKKVLLYTVDGRAVESPRRFRELVEELEDRFVLCHGYYLVNVAKARAVSGAPGRYRLHFRRPRVSVPISESFEDEMVALFGVSRLEYLMPSHPEARFLRLHGVIDFGYRELMDLDRDDAGAVRAFKERWNMARFSYERIMRYFKQVTRPRVDTVRFTRNVIWQTKRWIEWGLEPPYDGDLRTYWYGVRRALRRHTDVIDAVSGDSFNGILNQMILDEKLFKYADIGFFDLRSPYRRIGERRPEVLLVGEKQGHFVRLMRAAGAHGCTFACLKGYPAHIMLEYLSTELAAAGVTAETTPVLDVVMMVDFDWDGKQIGETFVRLIKQYTGIGRVRYWPLVKLADLTDEDIIFGRSPAARYYRHRGRYVPFDEDTSERKIRTAQKWLEWVADPRFFSKDRIQGKWVYTVWSVSSDALDWRDRWKEKLDVLLAQVVEDGARGPDLGRAAGRSPGGGDSPGIGPKRGEKGSKGPIRGLQGDWESPWADSGAPRRRSARKRLEREEPSPLEWG